MPEETDAFGRPLRPDAEAVPAGWAPPVPPPDDAPPPSGAWIPPSPSPVWGPASEPAGWWQRAGAAIIDGLIAGLTSVVLGAVITELADASDDASTGIAAVLGLIIGSAYYGTLMARGGERNGQTWGKQVTGIRVVRVDGRPVTFGYALLRELLVKTVLFGYLAVLTLYVATLLNYLWPLWDEQKRALHDRVARTLVRRA